MSSGTFYLQRPPVVGQADPAACWAAALSSWLRVTPNRPRYSQADILGKFDKRDDHGNDPRGIVGRDGGLDILKGFPQIARLFDMGSDRLTRIEDFTADYLLGRLQGRGHLYVAYAVPGKSWSHMIVVYGLGSSLGRSDPEVYFMDPEPDNTGSLLVRPLSFFRKNRGVYGSGLVVAWPQ